ncbi:alpha-amylase family glycosyl hydrolase [Allobaculum stercoricanis]|uniref:alpha-amylase family glycosyl hydrolase n=1 Tax=Allobaculum stercoricanis TaxID=174709 RepID=UPI0003649E35|nr:alpha-amylase family glycosyl hydrolase [Allobaculum stercoricanis]
MKMNKLFAMAISAMMLFSLTGCQTQQQQTTSALTLMNKINSSSVVDGHKDMRVWYQIDPTLFTDRYSGTPGTFKTVIQEMEYFSDGNPQDNEKDLSMTGILLKNILKVDDTYAVSELTKLNPTIGSDDDLSALCTKANSLNMPVLLTLDLGTISKNNSQFKAMIQLVSNLKEDEDPYVVDKILADEFFLEKDKEGQDGWTRIGQTPYYYMSLPNSDIPRINLDNQVWKQFIINAIEHYFALGVTGFYIPDSNGLVANNDQKSADFLKWFDSICKERKPESVNVFSYSSWNDPIAEVPMYAADLTASGAEGYVAKAATGSISARELGNLIEQNSLRTQNMTAYFLGHEDGSMDLLKSEDRIAQYKMILAIELMLNSQVMINVGDELGFTSDQSNSIVSAIEDDAQSSSETKNEDSQSESDQTQPKFENVRQQRENGDSILNFFLQAVRLRDSFDSITRANPTVSQELSTDQVLVLDRYANDSQSVLVFNLSNAQQEVDLSTVTISDLPAELGGVLLTGDQEIKLENNKLILPAYSMALLK